MHADETSLYYWSLDIPLLKQTLHDNLDIILKYLKYFL